MPVIPGAESYFHAGSSSTGVIAVSNAITLNGTTVMKLNGSGVNDEVQSGTGITYGGTLNLVSISGSALVNGNSFHIFSAASYAGSFAGIAPVMADLLLERFVHPDPGVYDALRLNFEAATQYWSEHPLAARVHPGLSSISVNFAS